MKRVMSEEEKKAKLQAFFAKASEAYNAGRREDAKNILLEAHEVDPQNAAILNDLGSICHMLRKLTEAYEYYSMAYALDKNDPMIANSLGLVCDDQGKTDDAKEWYKKALGINSNHLNSLNNLGSLLLKIKEYEESQRCLEQAVKLENDLPKENKMVRAHFNLGLLYARQNKIEEAKKIWEQVLTINETHNATVDALWVLKNYAQSETPKIVEIFEKVLVPEVA